MSEEEQGQQPRSRVAAEEQKALEKTTDVVQERELDTQKVKEAMLELAATRKADRVLQLQREKELAAVKINKGDIDVIAFEYEIDKKAAERRLRECQGDLAAALKSYL